MSLLLVTNDDGIHAAGLSALAEALAELGEVWVIAPEREQSACGHALTLHRPLRAVPMGERRFAVNIGERRRESRLRLLDQRRHVLRLGLHLRDARIDRR